ncbi:MAG: ribonuclease HI [Lachnospiraceae bacterium]|nr:ribonuclease HI [Lachnospiraceae bacterium]
MQVKIFSDGAAKGNPEGPGGYGTVIQYTDPKGVLHEKELSGGFRRTTNNRMELMGAIKGLEALNRPCEVVMVSDSAYVINAFNQHWIDSWLKSDFRRGKPNEVKNIDLWQRLLAAAAPHRITWTWVKGHAGHPENERCDSLACAAALMDDLPEDTVYMESLKH